MLETYLEQINNHLQNLYYVKEAKIKFGSLRKRIDVNGKYQELSEKYSKYNYYNKVHKIIQQCSNYNSVEIYGLKFSHTDRKYSVIALTLLTISLTPLIFKNKFSLRSSVPWFVFYSLLFCRESLNPYMNKA